jgi:hypothetical protein
MRQSVGLEAMSELATPVCGMTWGWVGERNVWASNQARESFDAMSRLNINWVTIAFQAIQVTAQSTDIRYDEPGLVTDEQVRAAIRLAHEQGLRVCLKPVVNCLNGTWRGFISFFDEDVPGEPSWSEWFASYRSYLNHFAQLAQEENVDLFCVGCEMVMTDKRADEWRETIRQVRSNYGGLITYNCDKYQEDRVTWWDAVDVISASGYYPQGSWSQELDRIEKVVLAHSKPFIFLEAGCPSREGSQFRPNDWTLAGKADVNVQSVYYEEMLTAFNRDWMEGFMLWDWPANLYDVNSAASNRDYCIFGKPAERVVAHVYSDQLQGHA